MLGFVVARALYDRFPEFSEGQLSKIRAHVVSRRSCAVVAAELGLDRRLEESGEIPDDLRRSSNVLAALMEAVLAALYLERGLDELAGPVIEAFEPRIEEALTESVDQKTTLQEELAKRGQRVEYVTLATDGPPHDRTFDVRGARRRGAGGHGHRPDEEGRRAGGRARWRSNGSACLA